MPFPLLHVALLFMQKSFATRSRPRIPIRLCRVQISSSALTVSSQNISAVLGRTCSAHAASHALHVKP
eukprot:4220598-Amphidinium_carterae.1